MKPKETARVCCKCGSDSHLRPMHDSHICHSCLETCRQGRDTTTKAARALSAAKSFQAGAKVYRLHGDAGIAEYQQGRANELGRKSAKLFEAREDFEIASGEAVRAGQKGWIADTLKAPDVVALDASAHRVELLGRAGNDFVALGIDVADSIKAGNSLERMLAHQLALAHKVALEVADKADFETNTVEKCRLLNVVVRSMDSFQRGLLVLQRLRMGGEQKITIHHVTVEGGGQAIVGAVQSAGEKRK